MVMDISIILLFDLKSISPSSLDQVIIKVELVLYQFIYILMNYIVVDIIFEYKMYYIYFCKHKVFRSV